MLVLAALLGLAALAVARARVLSRRGIALFAIDPERTPPEALADLAFVLCFLLWLFESVAFAWPLPLHAVPDAGQRIVLDGGVAKGVGSLVLVAGLAIYGLALRAMGDSWRLGIDRQRPGGLVTDGIFARSRNPIYLGLGLLALGSFLVLGRLVLGVSTLVFAIYFESLARREERFLAAHYGVAYRKYAQRVGRWWTWRLRGD